MKRRAKGPFSHCKDCSKKLISHKRRALGRCRPCQRSWDAARGEPAGGPDARRDRTGECDGGTPGRYQEGAAGGRRPRAVARLHQDRPMGRPSGRGNGSQSRRAGNAVSILPRPISADRPWSPALVGRHPVSRSLPDSLRPHTGRESISLRRALGTVRRVVIAYPAWLVYLRINGI